MFDEIGPSTILERLARLEERAAAIMPMLDEIHADQRRIAATLERAGGAIRVLLMLGTLVAAVGAFQRFTHWATVASVALTGGA